MKDSVPLMVSIYLNEVLLTSDHLKISDHLKNEERREVTG